MLCEARVTVSTLASDWKPPFYLSFESAFQLRSGVNLGAKFPTCSPNTCSTSLFTSCSVAFLAAPIMIMKELSDMEVLDRPHEPQHQRRART